MRVAGRPPRRVYSAPGGLRSAFVRGAAALPPRGGARALRRTVWLRRAGAALQRRAQLLDESLDRELAVARWLRSSWATARSTGPTRATTRASASSVSALDASTSKSASTRVSDFCACWPPGPDSSGRREARSPRRGKQDGACDRIDSRSMACILLDIDGVLHVSGEPIPGAVGRRRGAPRAGHALRFVTNNSTRPRRALAEELREMGFTLEDDEIQTTPGAAARELAGQARARARDGRRSFPTSTALELVGEDAEAVLIGGCDETLEPNQVFSYMNLARAFAEIQTGADLYCLHKNRWWQTSRGPMLDSGAFVAGLEYATGVEATVLGKPSPAYFAAALDALDAEPELTWLVRRRRRGRRARRAALRDADGARANRQVPARGARDGGHVARHRRLLARPLPRAARGGPHGGWRREGRRRHHRDRAHRACARAARVPRALLHGGRARVLRLARAPGAELRRAVRRQGSGRKGARLRRPLHVEGDRDRRPAEAGSAAVGADGGLRRARPRRARSTSR